MRSIQKALEKVYGVFEWIAKCFWYIAGGAMVAMAFVTTAGALARYIFRAPWALSYDLTCLLMTITAMMSMPYVQCQRENLRLDLFDKVFPAPVTKAIVDVITPVLGLFFTATLTKLCWDQAIFAKTIGEVTKGNFPYPSFPVKLVITVCAALICIILLLQLLMFLFGIGQNKSGSTGE